MHNPTLPTLYIRQVYSTMSDHLAPSSSAPLEHTQPRVCPDRMAKSDPTSIPTHCLSSHPVYLPYSSPRPLPLAHRRNLLFRHPDLPALAPVHTAYTDYAAAFEMGGNGGVDEHHAFERHLRLRFGLSLSLAVRSQLHITGD